MDFGSKLKKCIKRNKTEQNEDCLKQNSYICMVLLCLDIVNTKFNHKK